MSTQHKSNSNIYVHKQRLQHTFESAIIHIHRLTHSSGTLTPSLATVAATYQNFSGVKDWISSWRCTQKPSVGV